MELSLTDRIARVKNVASRQMGDTGETILLHLKSGYIYTCGDVGTFVWEALQTPATVGDLVQKICDEFEVAEDTAVKDLNRFLGDLVAERLVTTSKGNA